MGQLLHELLDSEVLWTLLERRLDLLGFELVLCPPSRLDEISSFVMIIIIIFIIIIICTWMRA